MRVAILIAAFGLVSAVSYPLVNRQIRIERENAAIEWLRAVSEAQNRFRTTQGGYAATLQSLVEPCLAEAASRPRRRAPGYDFALRPAHGSVDGPLDCHGRATSTAFYVSARPVVMGRDGLRGMATTSDGRIFVFFDGVPPVEGDMAPGGGAAAPLESMTKIP